jgi:hypothetical protein
VETEFYNGCEKQETLDLMNMFYDNPHCGSFMMSKCDECGDEYVYIGFTHYADEFDVKFNSETKVGELYINYKVEDKWETDYYGVITVDKLLTLLNKLPHITDFMEDETEEVGIFH